MPRELSVYWRRPREYQGEPWETWGNTEGVHSLPFFLSNIFLSLHISPLFSLFLFFLSPPTTYNLSIPSFFLSSLPRNIVPHFADQDRRYSVWLQLDFHSKFIYLGLWSLDFHLWWENLSHSRMEPNAFEQIWVQHASQIFHLLIYFIDKLNTLCGPE